MSLWALSIFCFLVAVWFLVQELSPFFKLSSLSQQRDDLKKVALLLREIEETFAVGLVPTPDRWERIQSLPPPWGGFAFECLTELRKSGGSLLPTLKRLRNLAEEHDQALADSQAKSSQAFVQACACSSLVPLLAGILYLILPGIEEKAVLWSVICGFGLLLSLIGVIWLLHMAEQARWGGLPPRRQNWVLLSQCAGERFLALLRTGVPPDLGWTQAIELLAVHAHELALHWGHSVWDEPCLKIEGIPENILISAGSSIRKAIQVTLMEGRPCAEHIETLLFALRQEIKSQVERELNLLGTRALKPLFICIAPALMGLLIGGLVIASTEILKGV